MSETTVSAPAEPRWETRVHHWTQTIAIVLAGLWAVWVFALDKIITPGSAPVNVSVGLSVQPAGSQGRASRTPLQAINLTITASNPSTRVVYILNNYWTARGIHVAARPRGERSTWLSIEQQSDNIRHRRPMQNGRAFVLSSDDVLAAGTALQDTALEPGEAVTRSLLFYVPRNEYDAIEVRVDVPTATQQRVINVAWTMNQTGAFDRHVVRRIGNDWTPVLEPQASSWEHSVGLQFSTSIRQLSLWTDDATPSPQAR